MIPPISCHAPRGKAVGLRRVRSTQRRQHAPHAGREGRQVVGVLGAWGWEKWVETIGMVRLKDIIIYGTMVRSMYGLYGVHF